MTLKVNQNFLNSFLGGHANALQLGSTPKLEIFSGVMPEVTDSFSFAPANYSAQRLGLAGTLTLQTVNGAIRFNQIPAAFNGTASGVAAWFALYNSSTASRCIIGTITSAADGTGVLLLENVNVVSGQPIVVTDLGVRAL